MMSGINRLFAAALLLCLVFTGCGAKETAAVPTPEGLVVNGLYTGFDAIPAGYAAKQAETDGCFVRDEAGGNRNHEALEAFLRDSAAGKAAFLRIMMLYEGEAYYGDLYYDGEAYAYYDSSATDREYRFPYLHDLSGRMPNAEADSRFLLLSGEADVSFEDAYMSMLSSTAKYRCDYRIILSL